MLHVDQFFINAGLDMNDRRIIKPRVLRHRVDGFLNSLELAATISGDRQRRLAEDESRVDQADSRRAENE